MGPQTPRNNLAAFDAVTGLPTAWDPDADAGVLTLVPNGQTVYVGGRFTNIGGQARRLLAEIDLSTGLVTSWAPIFTGLGVHVANAIAVSGQTLYAVGDFTMSVFPVGIVKHVCAFDAVTGRVHGWSPPTPDTAPLRAAVISGNSLYVAGDFAAMDGVTRNKAAALDLTTGALTAWNPDVSGPSVRDMVVVGNTMVLGGDFSSVGGVTRNSLAAVDLMTGLANGWDPNAGSRVQSLAVSGSTVYAGGTFATVGTEARDGVAAIDAVTGLPTAWNPGALCSISWLVKSVNGFWVNGNNVYVGGTMTALGGEPRTGFAAIGASGTDAPVTSNVSGGGLELDNLPNPFGAYTTIRFALPEAARVSVDVFDVAGRRVAAPVTDAWTEPGVHHVRFSGDGLASGVYLVRMEAGGHRLTTRATVLR